MSVMSTINLPNNGVNETGSVSEGFSPVRCPTEEQRGPGCNPATAPRIQRRKWSQEDNRTVMECYYQSEPRRNGYRKRMHRYWMEKEMFPVTEQRLMDQKNNIVKKKWLSDLELEEIRRNVEDVEQGVIPEEVEFDTVDDVAMGSTDRNNACEEIEINENSGLSDEEKGLSERLKNILTSNQRERLPSLRGVEKGRLQAAVRKVDMLLGKMKTNNITDTNNLIYAGAVLVRELLGLKKPNRNARREPWWKRRLEGRVKEMNKDLCRVNMLIEKKKIKHKHRSCLQNKYKITQKGLATVKEEILQRIKAITGKIKRYNNRINQYQQNRTFQNNQGKFYQQLNSGGKQERNPDAEAAKEFWEGIWGVENEHNESAEWLGQFKDEMRRNNVEQERFIITEEKMQRLL